MVPRNSSNVYSRERGKADPGNYREATLLSKVGKTIRKLLDDVMGTMMDKEDKLGERQAGKGLGQYAGA